MRLRTIGIISSIVLGLLVGPLPAEAQQAGKDYRQGILRSGSTSPRHYAPQHQILLPVLRELGYVEEKHPIIEQRYEKSKLDRHLCLTRSLFS